MDLSQVALQLETDDKIHVLLLILQIVPPVFATALISLKSNVARELSFEKGDLIQVQKDLGDGMVVGVNVSQGSTTGLLRLRNIELNVQTQNLEATQLAVEEMLLVRREYEEIRRKREVMQLEVALLHEAKDEMLKIVNPIRFSLRTLKELLVHIIQTDIESLEVAELVREAQNEWTSIVADINRLQASVDDPELDPFRRLVLDRCDGLKKRVAALAGPATETLAICKQLHVDLENLVNAFEGRPLVARSVRIPVEHFRAASQGSLASTSSSTSTGPSSVKSPINNFSGNGVTRPSALQQPLGGSMPVLPEFSTAPTASFVSADFFGSTSDAISRANTAAPSSGLSTPTASPVPRHLDRAAVLGGQRTRGSSPSLFHNNSASPSPPVATSVSPTPSNTSPAPSKFVFGTKPSSIKMEAEPKIDGK